MKYSVYNIADGLAYNGNSLGKAIRVADSNMVKPYVHSANGTRPVAEGRIGDFGQSYDDFLMELHGAG